MKTIKIEVNEDGTIVVDSDGFTGNSCREHLEALVTELDSEVLSEEDKQGPARATVRT